MIKKRRRLNTTFARIEFWAATTIFAFSLFFYINDWLAEGGVHSQSYFQKASLPFNFYKNYLVPHLSRSIMPFMALLYLHFIVVPALGRRQRLLRNITLVALTFIATAAVLGLTGFYLRTFEYNLSNPAGVATDMFKEGIDDAFELFTVFAIYTAIKYLSLYVLSVSGSIEAKYPFVRREGIVATIIWTIILGLMLITEASRMATAAWIIAIPSAILLYLLGFYSLIPISLNKRFPFISYWLRNLLILFLVLMAWGMILKIIVGGDQAHLAALWIFNSVLQLSITVPLTWVLYKRKMKGNEEVNVLKKELGQSTASFDFLRSQINPHFLFNALNTLYGTAMQEKADRTSEGIQKLGDMMRFMLQENIQEKISLAREVEYLENYISLQKLRTDLSPDINIDTHIHNQVDGIHIAPMLLIPFVENAFKHGISFREPSHIIIGLELKDNTLHFDVDNSKHSRHDNDPEKDRSGIGLANVKQRLELLYPGKHELLIRETAKDFYIHLTLQLSRS